MSYTDNQLKIVKWLDAPPKFAFWDMDVALIMVAFSTLGMILGHTLFLTAIGLFVTYFYSKFKTGKHHYFMLHLMFWFLPMKRKSKRVPNTNQREFLR